MPFTQIIVPAAGLQPFESEHHAFNVSTVLPNWREAQRLELNEDSLSTPFEMAYARALGLPSDEGKIAWAAFESQTLGRPCAWLHPCHLDVGMTDMVMQHADRLQLSDEESRELFALISPYFEQDGIALTYVSATKWLAMGAQFADFPCASLKRVEGRSINEFLADPGEFPAALKMSRLQAEVQMLLYTHPISEARQARGLPTVNSFWVDGTGALNAMPAQTNHVQLELRLQNSQHSEAAYLSAWQSITSEWAALSNDISITLCGEKVAVSLAYSQPSWKKKLLGFLGSQHVSNIRSML